MALWQFKVMLLPRAWFEMTNNCVESLFSNVGNSTSDAWREHQLKNNMRKLMSGALPSGRSWSKKLKFWGNLETTDIQIWYEDRLIRSISIRVDVRKPFLPFLQKIVEICNTLDCVLLVPSSRKIIEPNILSLMKEISTSVAFKFSIDRRGFITNFWKEYESTT
jgi:hypothetical protein